MPNGGKYAVLEDPQGAAFGVYVSPTESQPEGEPKLGEYSWHELATDDYRAAFEFYSALFGWEETGQHDMGAPLGVYFMFGRGGNHVGGMFKRMPDMPGGPSWLGYVRVKNIQQVIKKAKSAGATLLVGPMEVPGGDLIAQFNDPQGATFAVHTLAADVKRAAPAAADTSAAVAVPSESESEEEQAAEAGTARRKAVRKVAAKSSAKKSTSQPAKSAKKKTQAAAKKAGKKQASRKAARKGAKKAKTAKKRGAAGRGAKRPARKVAGATKAKKTAKKTRGGAKKKGKKARKAK
jgi:predicted enzyme related to lactoylglutathione lyase